MGVALLELARQGAPAGEKTIEAADGTVVIELVLRPEVGMAFLVGVPYACALGVARSLVVLGVEDAGVTWPYGAAAADGSVSVSIRTQAGFGEGVFVVVDAVVRGLDELDDLDDLAVGETIADGIQDGVAQWAAGIAAQGKAATPVGPILNEYFDLLLGKDALVNVVRDGRVLGQGRLVGMDVWGRATVRDAEGSELELAPEQASLRLA